MMKEHERREHLKTLDEEDRRKEEEHYEEMKKKHADHPKVNHPVSLQTSTSFVVCDFIEYILMPLGCFGPQGSKDQLKEVWEEADGLDPEDFDPKTFFNLHGKKFLIPQPSPRYENAEITSFIILHFCNFILQTQTEMASLMNKSWKPYSRRRYTIAYVTTEI